MVDKMTQYQNFYNLAQHPENQLHFLISIQINGGLHNTAGALCERFV